MKDTVSGPAAAEAASSGETPAAHWQSLCVVALAVVFDVTLTVPTAGYQALRPVLIDAGRGLASPRRTRASYSLATGVYADACGEQPTPCREQTQRLDRIFTVTMATNNMVAEGRSLMRLWLARVCVMGHSHAFC